MINWIDDHLAIYLDNKIQAHHIFDKMLQELINVDQAIISSFAITEPWVRRLIRHRADIKHITLFLDFTVASRKPLNTDYAARNVDELLLTRNHSKTIFMSSGNKRLLALISNNATNNQRYESGVIFSDHPAINFYLQEIETMKSDSVPWMK
jgi:hypothetical protein